jgi:hypothetical protein
MDFPREIYEAHRQLSQCSVKFIEFVRNNPEGLRRSHFDAIVNHPIFYYYRLQPWPTFVNRKMKQELKIVCMKVFNLIKSIPRRFFNYDFGKISQYFEIPVDRCRQLFEGVDDEYLAGMLDHGDFVISPTTGIKCIEYNVASWLGGYGQDYLEQVYTQIPRSYLYQAGETGCVPHQVVWGVFMFGARSPGGCVRVLPEQSSSLVINLNQGTEQSIIIEVEE